MGVQERIKKLLEDKLSTPAAINFKKLVIGLICGFLQDGLVLIDSIKTR